jgi:tartrate-resistant acid phosphatase type 5
MPFNDFNISRRTVLASVPALALASRVVATPTTAGLPFVAIGDWGRDGASHQRDVAAQMGHSAHASGSRFVISTGDNFYAHGVQSVGDRQWQTSFEQIYTHPALHTPWYPVLGNHDYRGQPQAEVDYSATSPRWRMPARYHSIVGATLGAPEVDLFFIDTSPLVHKYRDKVESVIAHNVASQDVAAQLAWLDGALAQSSAAWKLVFGHHTIFSGGSSHGNTVELVAQLKPILERRGVQAYVNGHEHDLQHIRVGAVDYICTGAGSEVRPTSPIDGTLFALARSGFATFKVERDRLALAFVDYTGRTVYRALLGRERKAA